MFSNNLFVTQPALTRRIQTLEAELGYTLFERKKGQKRIVLTDKGKSFISVAHRLEDLWQEALDIREQEHTDLLKISAINSVSSYILPEVFRSLSNEPQKIRISFHHCHVSYIIADMDFLLHRILFFCRFENLNAHRSLPPEDSVR